MPTEVSEGKSARVSAAASPLTLEVSAPPTPPDESVTQQCANCLTPLTGPFCAQCGQHVADYHRSVWRFVADFFDNVFCWDSKILRTLDPLIKRPGFLTQEFMAGRRVRYVHPLRLFLFTSAICLTLLQFNSGFNKARIHVSKDAKPGISYHLGDDDDDPDDAKPAKPASPAASVAPTPAPAGTPAVSPAPGSSTSPANPTGTEKGDSLGSILRDTITSGLKDQKASNPKAAEDLSKRLEAYGRDLEKKSDAGGIKAINKNIATNIQQKASWVALAMLPIFAWLMRFAYGRSGGYFFNYLVFSLHYHTFLLLFWTAYLWLGTLVKSLAFPSLGFILLPLLLAPPYYLYLSLRRFYGETRFQTAAKTFAIGGLHLLAIVIGVAIAGIGSSL